MGVWGLGPQTKTADKVRAFRGPTSPKAVDLLRRHSNRPDLLGPLVSVLRRALDPVGDGQETVTTIAGRTASPDYVRQILTEQDITNLIEAYRSGTTAKALAEQYGVHTSTIKKNLRKHGIRRSVAS